MRRVRLVSPLGALFADILRFSGEPLHLVNRVVRLGLHFSNSWRMFTAEGESHSPQLDSGTTARRTFVVVPIHSEVNRLGHPNRRSANHRPHLGRLLPPPSRP